MHVDQHESFPDDVQLVVDIDGETYAYSVWGEWLVPNAATTVVAEHTAGPAVTRIERGTGSVTYCGVWPEAKLLDVLVSDLLSRSGIELGTHLPDGVHLNGRDGLTWVTNFTSDRYEVNVSEKDIIIGERTLEPFDCVVVSASRLTVTIV